MGRRVALAPFIPLAWVLVTLAAGCARDEVKTDRSSEPVRQSPDDQAVRPVSLPDVSGAAASVQRQLQGAYSSSIQKIESPASTASERGNAYGDLGKLFMAAEYPVSAEACFLNAQALMPGDERWPYYLGHLYRKRGDLAKSAASFERTLRLQPGDLAALIWLGDVYLAQARPEAAESPLTKALSLQPRSVAALFGLGRVAVARHEYAAAVQYLEKALTLDRGASVVHYPLALAYRGLGEVQKAEAHLRQPHAGEIGPPDPLMDDLGGLLESAAAYEFRGIRALDRGDSQGAAAYFRKGIELAPDRAPLHHRLGTALMITGDARGALEQFEEALRLDPRLARAHYSLGVILLSSGKTEEAIERLSAAVKYEPNYVEAHFLLANALRERGQLREAVSHYEQIVRIDPRIAQAWLEEGMALVRLKRYQEARDRLIKGMEVHPDHPGFAHMLARLMAAAPDDRVRDGQRALALIQGLLTNHRDPDTGETMAMALAELGRYEDAATWQREAIAAAKQAGDDGLAQRMGENLKRYQRHEPCRTPWREDDMP